MSAAILRVAVATSFSSGGAARCRFVAGARALLSCCRVVVFVACCWYSNAPCAAARVLKPVFALQFTFFLTPCLLQRRRRHLALPVGLCPPRRRPRRLLLGLPAPVLGF